MDQNDFKALNEDSNIFHKNIGYCLYFCLQNASENLIEKLTQEHRLQVTLQSTDVLIKHWKQSIKLEGSS